MAVWVVKAGRMGEREQRILDHGVIAIGWEELGDLTNVQSPDQLKATYRAAYPDAAEGQVAHNVGQIWAFAKKMQRGDLVVTPIKTRSEVAVGTVDSDYVHSTQYGSDMQHVRHVKWLRTDIPRTAFDQDLLYSFGAFMTVCQVKRDQAETRIRAVAAGKAPPVAEETPSEPQVDLEEFARDQITAYVDRKFKGHGLALLVEGVLRAQGYVTKRSEPGPDGGVDILAGKGPVGLDQPRLCVQVKSSSSRLDVETYRALKGTMDSYQADQGLLVGWGGFTGPTRNEAEASYFRVRLWDKSDLVDAILRHYDQLPPEVQTLLPLERIWRLVLPPEEEI
jgi:restriction system protein